MKNAKMGGKNILITGCDRGIGLALVKYYLKLENDVERIFATFLDPKNSVELQTLAGKNPNKLHAIRSDITDYDSFPRICRCIDEIVGESGVNLLINNAGIGQRCGLEQIEDTPELMNQTLRVNCVGPYFFSQAMLPLLKKASKKNSDKSIGIDRAAIIMMSSDLASIGDYSHKDIIWHSYRSSKAALNMAMKNISLQLEDDNILVMSIYPGWVKTVMGGKDALITTEECVEKINNTLAKQGKADHGSFKNGIENTIIPF